MLLSDQGIKIFKPSFSCRVAVLVFILANDSASPSFSEKCPGEISSLRAGEQPS